MSYRKYLRFIFPLLIIFIGLFIYKILGYEPNLYTIIINIGLAFVLSPRVKKLESQSREKEQVTWLFFKKTKIIK
jgi:positive regulator of sigma E activity